MAVLRAETTFTLGAIAELAKQFPSLNGRYLSLIGKRARNVLKQELLSGQELNLNAYPRDKRGKYTITSDVNKRRTQVKIYAYPVNLFERGRKLRSGKKEPGKYIITRKLKDKVTPRVPSYIMDFERRILGDEIHKLGLDK